MFAFARRLALVLVIVVGASPQEAAGQLPGAADPQSRRLLLQDGWLLKSSAEVKEDGDVVSTVRFAPAKWYPVAVPSTVLNALVRNGVYPDMRVGLNNFLIPDASDEFNAKHDLAVDGRPREAKLAWARAGRTEQVHFEVKLPAPGSHRVQVGSQTRTVLVQ